MPTIKKSYTSEIVDNQTGKTLKKTQNIDYHYDGEPAYIKLYLEDILYLCGLPKSTSKVLFWLLKNCNYANDARGGNCVTLNPGQKKFMMEEIGIKSKQTIKNAISELTKVNLLERIATGVYRLNPYLFGRGDWRDIKSIRMTVEYDLSGRNIESYVNYGNRKHQKVFEQSLDKMVGELEKSFAEEKKQALADSKGENIAG